MKLVFPFLLTDFSLPRIYTNVHEVALGKNRRQLLHCMISLLSLHTYAVVGPLPDTGARVEIKKEKSLVS